MPPVGGRQEWRERWANVLLARDPCDQLAVGEHLPLPQVPVARDGGKSFYIDPKGVELCLWNEDSIREPQPGAPLIMTEGEIDALSFLSVGEGAVVPVLTAPLDAPVRATSTQSMTGNSPTCGRAPS